MKIQDTENSLCNNDNGNNNNDGNSDNTYCEPCHNQVVKITDVCRAEIMEACVPLFTDYDVLIRTDSIAISGSDIHYYETGSNTRPTMSIGHDASGIIEKVGKCIYCLRPGDRVAIEAGLSCGICNFCKHGAYNMCSQMIFNGFFTKYQVHPADLCYKLPENISTEEGALVQTLALGCQACFQAHVKPTSNVLVIGSCATAVSAALCARALGAQQICLTCKMHNTLETIRKHFDFDYVLYDEYSFVFSKVLENIYCTLTDWPDLVINCSVSEITMNLAVMALKPCGQCVLTACESECASFNAIDVLMKNIRLIPSFRSTNMFPTAIRLMQSGQAPMQNLIAKCFGWSEVEKAFQTAQYEANVGNRKVIVKCAEEENWKESLNS